MRDRIRDAFLERQHEQASELAASSDILQLRPMAGSPPEAYVARFDANGFVQAAGGEIVVAPRCDVGVRLPADYLRRAEAGEILTYLGPTPRPWHPNMHLHAPVICLHLTPGMPLVDILYALYEVWTYSMFRTNDPLNEAASQWARSQDRSRFPCDRRPLKRPVPPAQLAPADPESGR